MRRANEFNTFTMLPATDIEAAQKGSWVTEFRLVRAFSKGESSNQQVRPYAGVQVEPRGTGCSFISSQCENRSCA